MGDALRRGDQVVLDPADQHVDGQLAGAGAAVRALDGRDVGVVAAVGDLDVVAVHGAVVGRVEPDPAGAGDVDLDPGMAGLRALQVLGGVLPKGLGRPLSHSAPATPENVIMCGPTPLTRSNVIAGGAGNPADRDVTAEDIQRLMELARDRHQ